MRIWHKPASWVLLLSGVVIMVACNGGPATIELEPTLAPPLGLESTPPPGVDATPATNPDDDQSGVGITPEGNGAAKPTPRSELSATAPSSVELASGDVQLVEFFAFW